jgi:periplasmic copper chaperone A
MVKAAAMPAKLWLPGALALLWSLPLAASHSFSLKGIEIGHPYALATVAGAPTGAVYLVLHNRAPRADRLVAATTPRAKRVELHAMSLAGDIMRMREVDDFELKPGEEIRMRPGSGRHLMLVGLASPLKAGEQFPLTLRFRSAGQIQVTVVVQEPAAPKARAEDHHHQH